MLRNRYQVPGTRYEILDYKDELKIKQSIAATNSVPTYEAQLQPSITAVAICTAVLQHHYISLININTKIQTRQTVEP